MLQIFKFYVRSKGRVYSPIETITVAICGDESISSSPIESNYQLTNMNKKVSWDYSSIFLNSRGERLPSLEEVRAIIANTAGENSYSTDRFSNDPLSTSAILTSELAIVACGNETARDWVSVGRTH